MKSSSQRNPFSICWAAPSRTAQPGEVWLQSQCTCQTMVNLLGHPLSYPSAHPYPVIPSVYACLSACLSVHISSTLKRTKLWMMQVAFNTNWYQFSHLNRPSEKNQILSLIVELFGTCLNVALYTPQVPPHLMVARHQKITASILKEALHWPKTTTVW